MAVNSMQVTIAEIRPNENEKLPKPWRTTKMVTDGQDGAYKT